MKFSEEDLKLIGGEFMTADLPQDKAWLARYFHSDRLYRFLVYYVTFQHLTKRISLRYYWQSFIDHTGLKCHLPHICRVSLKIRKLEKALADAQQNKDLEKISDIKLGRYIVR